MVGVNEWECSGRRCTAEEADFSVTSYNHSLANCNLNDINYEGK